MSGHRGEERIKWHSIKTAPRDGTRILVSVFAKGGKPTDSVVRMAFYCTDKWLFEDSCRGVHDYGYEILAWMPVPKAISFPPLTSHLVHRTEA